MSESEVRLGELIDAVAEGDRSALEKLFQVRGAKLYAVVLRIVREPEPAADALGDAYRRIWRDALNYTPALLDAESWLVMHARRAAFDIARKRAAFGHDETADAHGAEAEEPDTSSAMSEELRQFLACLAQLNADPRLMLLLAYFDGWSRAELAIEFDAPAPTIRTWMLRGLEQLRDCTSQ